MKEAEAVELLLSDRQLFIETLLEIENKERQLVPFKLNPIQSDMIAKSTGRDIYVKPGQIGASSVIIADYIVDVITVPGTVAVIISYDEFIAGRLLNKAQMFYDALKERVPSIPAMHHKSTNEKTFPKVHGSFYIGSARSFMFGRGETIHRLLIDEFAFWQPGDAERIAIPTIQRVPLSGRAAVVSTPNGEDNEFCEMYKAAKEGIDVGKSVFTPHFYTWLMHPEYAISAGSPYALPGDNVDKLDLTPDEEKLHIVHGATDDQIRWRRRKIAEMESMRLTGETRLLFPQEYPEDDVSCFLQAGDIVYDLGRINDLAKTCYPAAWSNLGAEVWYPPEAGLKYLIGIDPGLGKESKSVATVWTFTDDVFKHCATLAGLYPPEIMAQKTMELGFWYNTATLAGEANIEFVNYIKDYPNVYYQQDIITGRPTQKLGWLTTPRTKIYMITELNRNLAKIICHDNRIVSQLKNIRWYNSRPVSLGSDDFHDSAAIAIVCRESLPTEIGIVGVSGWKW